MSKDYLPFCSLRNKLRTTGLFSVIQIVRNRSQTQIWVSCHLKSSFSCSQLPGQWRIHWTGGGLCLATGTWYVWQGTGISRNGHKNCQTSSSCSSSRRWSCPEGDSSWDMRHCHPGTCSSAPPILGKLTEGVWPHPPPSPVTCTSFVPSVLTSSDNWSGKGERTATQILSTSWIALWSEQICLEDFFLI